MTPGRVWSQLQEKLSGGRLHFTLLDPASVAGDAGVEIARRAKEFGTAAFMVGGSTGVTSENLDALVTSVKSATGLPVIHFPNQARALSRSVDAIFFMSTLNSRNPRFITREQMLGAPVLKALGIEPLGMGYIIVEPGMTVGKVSEAELIPRTKEGAMIAAAYALAAEYFGMRLVYLEGGSGAREHVPPEIVRAVKGEVSIPVMVGGGIRAAEHARAVLEAGADIVVTGTVAEKGSFDALRAIIAEVGKARPVKP